MKLFSYLKLAWKTHRAAWRVSREMKHGEPGSWEFEARIYGMSDERREEILEKIWAEQNVEKLDREDLGYMKVTASTVSMPLGSSVEHFISSIYGFLRRGGASQDDIRASTVDLYITESEKQEQRKTGRIISFLIRYAAGLTSAESQLRSNVPDEVHSYKVSCVYQTDRSSDFVAHPLRNAEKGDLDAREMAATADPIAAIGIAVRDNLSGFNRFQFKRGTEMTFSARPALEQA